MIDMIRRFLPLPIKRAITRLRDSIFVPMQPVFDSTMNICNCKDKLEQRIQYTLDSPARAEIEFHPLAGQISNGRQYFFDGNFTLYPWADESLHQLLRETKGAADPEEIVAVLNLLNYLPDNLTMMELGAGWAFFSIVIGKRKPNGSFYLVEANPQLVNLGHRNMVANGLGKKVTVIKAAISGEAGLNVRFRDEGLGGSLNAQGNIETTTETIQSLMQKQGLDYIDLIHMDIQGEEVAALHASEKLLHQNKIGALVIGTHGRQIHSNCEDILKSVGYTILSSLNDFEPSLNVDGVLVAAKPELAQII